jgi:hypothetical protein
MLLRWGAGFGSGLLLGLSRRWCLVDEILTAKRSEGILDPRLQSVVDVS